MLLLLGPDCLSTAATIGNASERCSLRVPVGRWPRPADDMAVACAVYRTSLIRAPISCRAEPLNGRPTTMMCPARHTNRAARSSLHKNIQKSGFNYLAIPGCVGALHSRTQHRAHCFDAFVQSVCRDLKAAGTSLRCRQALSNNAKSKQPPAPSAMSPNAHCLGNVFAPRTTEFDRSVKQRSKHEVKSSVRCE